MTEAEFWADLEYRLSRALSQLRDNHLRFLWCDGFIPDDVQPNDRFLVGRALMSEDSGRSFEHYRFRLEVNPAAREPHGMNWSAVLPEDLCHGRWFVIDRDRKHLELQPVAHDVHGPDS